MTRVALLTPCQMEADAVGNDVAGMYHVLQRRGHDVGIFASSWHRPGVKVRHINRLAAVLNDRAALLIYHHSIGWRAGARLMRHARCRRVVRYHNTTPAKFYEQIHSGFATACWAGREQLSVFARAGCDRYLADSDYNLQELFLEGVPPAGTAVVPPFHRIDRLETLETDQSVLNKYRDGRTNILMVGRVAPNKGHTALIDAFAAYHRRHNSNSRLLIVGRTDRSMAAYIQKLNARVATLGLQDFVVFTGAVSDRALKAYYLVADVFMITSEHEGFCVPLVEAMAMKVPVVALGSTAIPETVGKAGLVWETAQPDLLAESIHSIVTDEPTRTGLGFLGWQRYRKQFANDQIEAQFLRALDGLL